MKTYCHWRYVSLVIINLSCFIFIGYALAKVVLDVDDVIKIKSNEVYERTINISADRGDILDVNGHLLAGTTLTYYVWIDPVEFEANTTQIESMAKLFGISEEALLAKINQINKRYVVLEKNISQSVCDDLKAMNNASIHIESKANRFYPLGDAVAPLIGLVDNELNGIDGIELAFNNRLSGKPGYRTVLQDRHGHIIKYLDERQSHSGQSLSLTIDSILQIQAFKSLGDAVESSHAESAMAVIVHVPSGEIRAMVNWPTFDPNNRAQISLDQVKNRAVTDMFEPGSTMKPFAMAHLLETNAWDETETVDVSKGYLVMKDGHIVKDVHVSKDPINMEAVMQKSSNVAVAKMMIRKPSFDFANTLSDYGFCHKTINDFPGEINGVCHANYDSLFELSTLSFGYGIGVNTLQLTQAFSVFANDGVLKPVVIEKNAITDPPKQVISLDVAKAISRMLVSVARSGGTGQKAALNGINVAGKTGTSYLVGKHGYDHSKHLSSYVGFAPADNPQYVVAVVLRNPDHAYRYGGVAAAPVFAEMMSAALGYQDKNRSI